MHIAMTMGLEPFVPDAVTVAHRAQATALARALADRGHRVTVYLDPDAEPLADPLDAAGGAVALERAPAGDPSPQGFADYLRDRWSDAVPDVVHAVGPVAGLASVAAGAGWATVTGGTNTRIALVQDARAIFPPRAGITAPEGGPGTDRIERLLAGMYRQCDQVLTSDAAQSEVLTRYGLTSGMLSVLPYGLTAEAFGSAEQANIPPGTGTLVCPDGPGRRDGAPDAVAALARLPEATLIVTGGPAAEDLDRDLDAQALYALAQRLQVRERVRLTGALSPKQMRDWYQEADLVLSVPREPTPGSTTCLEAMASGACVLATQLGGAADAVLPGITGMFVPAGVPDALTRAVRSMLRETTRVASYGMAAADRAKVRYGWDQLAQDSERAYARATSAAAAVPRPRPGGFTRRSAGAQPLQAAEG